MAGNIYRALVGGVYKWITAKQASAGAGDAGVIPALDATGRLDTSFMPSGIGAATRTATATAAISAGMWVNIYTVGGAQKARPADNTSATTEANAFATAAVSSGASGTFTLVGINGNCSGLTADAYYYLGTVGGQVLAASVPTAAGSIIQGVGKALSTTEIEFEFDFPGVIA